MDEYFKLVVMSLCKAVYVATVHWPSL